VSDDGRNAERRARRKARRIAWAVRIGGVALRALAATWRVREVRRGGRDPVRDPEEPAIFCLWHGELLCHLWAFRGNGIVVLISEHGDGEIVARLAEALGYHTIRGSSTRGAERALLGLIREVRAGRHVAITPDGPRGPAEQFAPGALIAAQRSGAPIVTLRATTTRAWRLGSWDRFMIPKPFARVTITVGAPRHLAAERARDAAALAPELQRAMRETVEPAHA
jgi:lysophospholipid acyltransferase (LPLAT)-like uncharacterized protein